MEAPRGAFGRRVPRPRGSARGWRSSPESLQRDYEAAPTMLPRRSARVAGVAERESEARSARSVAAAQLAAPALAPLPHALVLHILIILSLLPVDCRLLAPPSGPPLAGDPARKFQRRIRQQQR